MACNFLQRELSWRRRSRLTQGRSAQLCDDFAVGKNEVPLDHVFQLANVAGPVVTKERFKQVFGQLLDGTLIAFAILLHKIVAKKRNVLTALAQRWNLYL